MERDLTVTDVMRDRLEREFGERRDLTGVSPAEELRRLEALIDEFFPNPCHQKDEPAESP